MNELIANFDQILGFAKEYNLPLTKKRAILREYLQCKILDIFYRQEVSANIIFTGGTSLRLTCNLDRFSEDLDFDLAGDTTFSEVENAMQNTFHRLEKENFALDFYKNRTSKRHYFELRFKEQLAELNISQNQQEKLSIKFDFDKFWNMHDREVVLLNRYGFLVNVVTITKNQQLVQKFTTYLKKKQTQPRDIYDIVWLISHQAKIDSEFAKKNGVSENLTLLALKKFAKEKHLLPIFQERLKPFLINESYADKLYLFPKMVSSLS